MFIAAGPAARRSAYSETKSHELNDSRNVSFHCSCEPAARRWKRKNRAGQSFAGTRIEGEETHRCRSQIGSGHDGVGHPHGVAAWAGRRMVQIPRTKEIRLEMAREASRRRRKEIDRS